jgi:hypothetical protein
VAFGGRLHAVGHLDAGGPRLLRGVVVRNPDADVGIFLGGATEPRGDDPALGRLDNRRGVAGRIGGFFVDELVSEERGRGGDTRERGAREEGESGEEFHGVMD